MGSGSTKPGSPVTAGGPATEVRRRWQPQSHSTRPGQQSGCDGVIRVGRSLEALSPAARQHTRRPSDRAAPPPQQQQLARANELLANTARHSAVQSLRRRRITGLKLTKRRERFSRQAVRKEHTKKYGATPTSTRPVHAYRQGTQGHWTAIGRDRRLKVHSAGASCALRMIIMKFGGTSLGEAAAIQNACELVAERLGQDPVLVVSAHAGVTDALDALAHEAVSGQPAIGVIVARHRQLAVALGLAPGLHAGLLGELDALCRGIALVGELSPRSRDYVLSFGERLAARTIAATLTERGIRAQAIDAFDIGVHTSSDFGRARLLPDQGRIARWLATRDKDAGLAVITGFIGKDERGNISTLGRDGSDLSAAFIGNALDADEIQIWTDVDGILTADPKIVRDARPIPHMSFDEAAELANHGGKVLHPASLAPAIAKSIPVRVLNTHKPDSPGTLIVPDVDDPELVVRCIAHKRHVTLVNIESSSMLAQAGFLSRIFGAFERHGISIDMVTTSEVSVSVTLDNTTGLDAAVDELAAFSNVSVERDLGLICVVGHGMRHRMGVPARVFDPLKAAAVEIRMISLGALKVNVSLIVDGPSLDRAVGTLHDEFFGRAPIKPDGSGKPTEAEHV